MPQTEFTHPGKVARNGLVVDIMAAKIETRIWPDDETVNLQPGTFVKKGGADGEVETLASGDDDADIIGMVVLHESGMAGNTGASADVDGYEPGSVVPIMYEGTAWAKVDGSVTEGDGVRARIVAAGAEVIGEPRASGDGTAQVITVTPDVLNSTEYSLQYHFTAGPAKGETHIITYVSDGSATATEICDGLRASLNANARLAALVTESGTTTMVNTMADKESVAEIESVGEGTFTSITETTAAAPDTAEVKNAKFTSTASDNGLAKIRLNRV